MKRLFFISVLIITSYDISKAAIHHFIVEITLDETSNPKTFELNLNNDSISDYDVNWHFMGGGYVETTITPKAGNKLTNETNNLKEIIPGGAIDSTLMWGYSDLICAHDFSQYPSYSEYGLHCDKKEFYVGLQITVNGEIYYGWAKLSSISQYYNGIIKITLHEFAYEDIPNKPINAGEVFTDIETPFEHPQFKMYPNPSNNNLTVETKINQGFYFLTDINGKQLLTGSIASTKFTLDLNILSSGIYFFNIRDENGLVSRKIVKQ